MTTELEIKFKTGYTEHYSNVEDVYIGFKNITIYQEFCHQTVKTIIPRNNIEVYKEVENR